MLFIRSASKTELWEHLLVPFLSWSTGIQPRYTLSKHRHCILSDQALFTSHGRNRLVFLPLQELWLGQSGESQKEACHWAETE